MILHIIMSCNRPEYLLQSLASIRLLDFAGWPVHRVLVDDYPKGRNNELFVQLARTYSVDDLILNHENKGLSVVWGELWRKYRGFEYVVHQEDDVVLLQPVNINTWIKTLDGACNSVLTRQKWYDREEETQAKETDTVIDGYRVEYKSEVFSPMFSLYRGQTMEAFTGDLNEGMIMHKLRQKAAYVKTPQGENMIRHIGEWKTGKIISAGDPGWDDFKHYKPERKYCSKTGKQWHK